MPVPSDHPAANPLSSLVETMRAGRATNYQATVAEIEREAARQVAAVQTELIHAALATREPAPAPECPTCGRVMVHNRTRTRTITTSQAGGATLTGSRCSACRTALFPLPEALDVGASDSSTWIVEGIVFLGIDRPFTLAA